MWQALVLVDSPSLLKRLCEGVSTTVTHYINHLVPLKSGACLKYNHLGNMLKKQGAVQQAADNALAKIRQGIASCPGSVLAAFDQLRGELQRVSLSKEATMILTVLERPPLVFVPAQHYKTLSHPEPDVQRWLASPKRSFLLQRDFLTDLPQARQFEAELLRHCPPGSGVQAQIKQTSSSSFRIKLSKSQGSRCGDSPLFHSYLTLLNQHRHSLSLSQLAVTSFSHHVPSFHQITPNFSPSSSSTFSTSSS